MTWRQTHLAVDVFPDKWSWVILRNISCFNLLFHNFSTYYSHVACIMFVCMATHCFSNLVNCAAAFSWPGHSWKRFISMRFSWLNKNTILNRLKMVRFIKNDLRHFDKNNCCVSFKTAGQLSLFHRFNMCKCSVLHHRKQTTQDHTDFVKVIIVEYFDVFFSFIQTKGVGLNSH